MSLFSCKVFNDLGRVRGVILIFRRFKSKKDKVSNPCKKALDHYDDFYKSVFGEKWPSVRLALLSKQKYMAVINNFGDNEKTEKFFQNQGAVDLKIFLEQQKSFTETSSEDAKPSQENRLERIITQQLWEEEEKESKIHPEGCDFKSKVDYMKEKEENQDDEYVYKPEDARISLQSDLKKADIDETRMIHPDSKISEGTLSEFIPATKLRGLEQFIPESEYYKYYQAKVKAPISTENQNELDFSENLKVYTFDRGDISDFPSPTKSILNVYDYLKLDGSELLTALALDVQPNETVLDMCSRSGNITYCLFQGLRAKLLLCTNDKKGHIDDMFYQYLHNYPSGWNNMLHVTSTSADSIEEIDMFDKVLVDVPCTEDRTSLFENENNMFHVLKIRDRLRLPEVQCSLLVRGLKLVRPGGTVVYTAATLSPIQSDGVVSQALSTLWEEEGQDFTVINLSPALRHTSLLFNYGNYLNLRFGTLVVPYVAVNFGPRYICKIKKNEKQK